MDAHPTEMSTILAGPKQFIIPVFQRFYSWQLEEWENLWKDIMLINQEQDERLTHFIGPFIIISKTRVTGISSTFLVIDGQQRLITLTVLLSALRDRARSLGLNDLAESIEANSISFLDGRGKKQIKIIPRIKDKETLQKIVLGQNLDDDDSSMAQAYKYFAAQLKKYSEDPSTLWEPSHQETLENLHQTIIGRLKLVMISLDDFDSPSNVYESLNYKGDKLSDADLIRNYVFMQLTLDHHEAFDNNIWRSFEDQFVINDQLDREILTDFYYRYLISRKGYFPKNLLYVTFMDYVRERVKSEDIDALEELVHELRRFARYYIRIVLKSPPEPELKRTFERITLLDVDTLIPLIMSLYDRYEDSNATRTITLSEFITMLQAVESFIIRRSILRMRARGYGLDFADAIDHSNNFSDLTEYLSKKGWPSDEDVISTLIEFPIYHHERKRTLLILLEIERSFGHKEKVEPQTLTIEHIMPQNLNLPWRNQLGKNAEEIHRLYVHTLGNLTLTGYNETLSDRDFEKKKKLFKDSNIRLNRDLAKYTTWSLNEIQERTKLLAKEFVKLWPRSETQDKPTTLGPEHIQSPLF